MSGSRNDHSTRMEHYVYFDTMHELTDNVEHQTELATNIHMFDVRTSGLPSTETMFDIRRPGFLNLVLALWIQNV